MQRNKHKLKPALRNFLMWKKKSIKGMDDKFKETVQK